MIVRDIRGARVTWTNRTGGSGVVVEVSHTDYGWRLLVLRDDGTMVDVDATNPFTVVQIDTGEGLPGGR